MKLNKYICMILLISSNVIAENDDILGYSYDDNDNINQDLNSYYQNQNKLNQINDNLEKLNRNLEDQEVLIRRNGAQQIRPDSEVSRSNLYEPYKPFGE